MEKLNSNWYLENHMDIEYQQYRFLSWLQFLESKLLENKLYPYFIDIENHIHNMTNFLNFKELVYENMPTDLNNINKIIIDKKGKIKLKKEEPENEFIFKWIEELFIWCLKKLENFYFNFRKIYNKILLSIKIEIFSLIYNKNIGYLLVNNKKFTSLYSYDINLNNNYIESLEWNKINKNTTWKINNSKDWPIIESVIPISLNEIKKY